MAPPRILTARILAACVLLAAATPAVAQPGQFEIDALRAQQEAAARRAIAQENELAALEARFSTEQAIASLQAQRNPPRAPELLYVLPSPSSPAGATPTFPTIPDAALAESNRRVRDASQPRR